MSLPSYFKLNSDAAICQRQYRAVQHCREAIMNCLETRQYSVPILSALTTLARLEKYTCTLLGCTFQPISGRPHGFAKRQPRFT